MENIFNIAENCLYHRDIEEKLGLTEQAISLVQTNQLSFENNLPVKSSEHVLFPYRPILLAPRKLPNRSLHTDDGKAAFFHALAHIEFMAIYLAWDIIYRFRGLPKQFYLDWLKVADEEAQHFRLLRQYLHTYSIDYGDLPAHQGLWEHATDTDENLLARLAIVPRCMEARGLDVTPTMIEKLSQLNDQQGVAILQRIFQDEIGHVQLGSYWFKFFCKIQGLKSDAHYQELLRRYFKGWPKGPFNRETRIIAGFSHQEIDWLEQGHHE